MKWWGWVIVALIVMPVASLFLGVCNTATKMVDNGAKVVYDEFKPEELLKKYSWFKDASAALDAHLANLSAYHRRMSDMRSDYDKDSSHRSKWSRGDQDQYNQWENEEAGIRGAYNTLAAEYNSQMSKFNWRFCNVGGLPQGQSQVLPREYKPYQY